MAPPRSAPTPPSELADRLQEDIRHRQLSVGDGYLSAAEAAKHLRVSTTSANQALQVLAERGVLKRRQRTGAVIAMLPRERHLAPGDLDCIYLLLPGTMVKRSEPLLDGLRKGLQTAAPNSEIRVSPLSVEQPEDDLALLLQRTQDLGTPSGFVLLRSSLRIQRVMSHANVPTAAMGGIFPSIEHLSSADLDHAATGLSLMEHLAARGCSKVLVLLRDQLLPGDQGLLDGILAAQASGAFPAGSITLRCLPPDDAVVHAQLANSLGGCESTGILCRSKALLKTVHDYCQAEDKWPALAVADAAPIGSPPIPHAAHVRPQVDAEQAGELIGRLLHERAQDPSAPATHRRLGVTVVPAELHRA